MAEMSDDSNRPSPAALRTARLAEALRENLRRRKAQSRARTGEAGTPAPAPADGVNETAPDREGGEA